MSSSTGRAGERNRGKGVVDDILPRTYHDQAVRLYRKPCIVELEGREPNHVRGGMKETADWLGLDLNDSGRVLDQLAKRLPSIEVVAILARIKEGAVLTRRDS